LSSIPNYPNRILVLADFNHKILDISDPTSPVVESSPDFGSLSASVFRSHDFTSNGSHLAVAQSDYAISVFPFSNGTFGSAVNFNNFPEGVISLSFSSDDQILHASNSTSGYPNLRRLKFSSSSGGISDYQIGEYDALQGGAYAIYAVAAHPTSSSNVAIGYTESGLGKVQVLYGSQFGYSAQATYEMGYASTSDVQYSPNASYIAAVHRYDGAGRGGGRLVILDANGLAFRTSADVGSSDGIPRLEWSPDGNYIVTHRGNASGSDVRLFDYTTASSLTMVGSPFSSPTGSTNIRSVAFIPTV